MEYWLIVYVVEGNTDVKNIATTEDPFDFIVRRNTEEMESERRAVSVINFWSITKENYDKLCAVI